MRISAIHCVYYSATYTTAAYARYIAEGFGLKFTEHDITGPDYTATPINFADDELVIFGAPVFGGRIPEQAAERFKLFTGKGPAIVICAYGNRAYEDALLELNNIAVEQGFTVAAAAAVLARHSLLTHHATERPNLEDRTAAISFGRKVLDKLSNNSISTLPALHIPGNFPYKEIGPAAAWLPYATDECNQCQTCVKRCPVQVIPAQNPQSTNAGCIHCGRCLLVCPRKARKIPDPIFATMRQHLDKLCEGHKEAEWIL